MTDQEKFNTAEVKERLFEQYSYKCKCGKIAMFLAHRIAKTKNNIRIAGKKYCETFDKPLSQASKWGKVVIHHELNLEPVCQDPRCNDRVNIGFNTIWRDRLIKIIINVMEPE